MMQEIIREEFKQEDASALAACLCQTLHSQFEPSILPQELDEEFVHFSLNFCLFFINSQRERLHWIDLLNNVFITFFVLL